MYPPENIKGTSVYGGYKWLSSYDKDANGWLREMAKFTKEPLYTSLTNIKIPNDYIFYQGKGLNVLRVVDVPDYTRVTSAVHTLPHPLMPSDHLFICVDFLIVE